MAIGKAKALLTTETLYERKVAGIRASLPDLEHVIVTGETGATTEIEGTEDHQRLMLAAPDEFESARPTRRMPRSSTSRAARPARRKAPSTSTARSSCTTSRASSPRRGPVGDHYPDGLETPQSL